MSGAPEYSTSSSFLLRLFSLPRRARVGFAPILALGILTAIVLITVFAGWLAPHDPGLIEATKRLRPASAEYPLGTDALGRDLLSRVLYGGRVSLLIGVLASFFSVLLGLLIGLVAGFFRLADAIIMRIMDSLMAIPGVLLAIALVALNGASVTTVIVAIVVGEVPRVVRLVRSVVLSAREQPYVEAAIALGSSFPVILRRHLMPNTLAPLIVQGTFITASAILVEAMLSFLGAGISSETPTWGNIMAEGRQHFLINPSLIFWPGLMLFLCILSINLIGDAARDVLDPKLKKREH